MNITASKALNFLKIGVALSVLTALFMSYQIPYSFYKTFKLIFLIMAILGMFLIMNYKTERSRRLWNLILTASIGCLAVLTFLED